MHDGMGTPAWQQALEQHLAYCELRNLRPLTIRARRAHVERLARAHDPVTVAPAALYAWWETRPLSAASRASELPHLRQWFVWLQRSGYRTDDPTLDIPTPRVPRHRPRPIAVDDMERAIETARGPLRDWLTLAGYAGLRAFEIAALRGEDIDRAAGQVHVRDGKGGHQRSVPAHPRVLALDLPDRGPCWINARGRPYSRNSVCHATREHLHALGIQSSLHKLRVRFGTSTHNACRDLRVVQELLGHASVRTTQLYVEVDDDRYREAVLALP